MSLVSPTKIMNEELWFGTWLLVILCQSNAQVHTNNFRDEPPRHRFQDERHGEISTRQHGRVPEPDAFQPFPRSHHSVKNENKGEDNVLATFGNFNGLRDKLRPHQTSPDGSPLSNDLVNIQSGNQHRKGENQDALQSSQNNGAFTSQSGDQAKARTESLLGSDGRPIELRSFNDRTDRQFRSNNELFFDNARRQRLGNSEIDSRLASQLDDGLRSDREPVVGHSIFVNANPSAIPRRQVPSSFNGEGPIIIQRENNPRGRPVLIDLEQRRKDQRDQLIGNSNRVVGSKFGPVFTTIHGQRGSPDIVIPRPFDPVGPPIPDSRLGVSQGFGPTNFPSQDRSFVIHPNRIPTVNRQRPFRPSIGLQPAGPSNFPSSSFPSSNLPSPNFPRSDGPSSNFPASNRPSSNFPPLSNFPSSNFPPPSNLPPHQFPSSKVPFANFPPNFFPNSNRRTDSFDRRPQSHPQAPAGTRPSFFPDLRVLVDQPQPIQPEIRFEATSRPDLPPISTSFVSIDHGAASPDNRDSRRRTQFPFPSTNRQFNNPQLEPSLFSQNQETSGSIGSRGPYRVKEEAPIKEYSYGYSVNAPSTGDHKAAYEEQGPDGVVRGQYSLLQPDGLIRLVSYEADAENGFRADVEYTPA